MAIEKDPSKINDYERRREATTFKEAEAYNETRKESKALNKKRAESRDRIKEAGIHTLSYQWGIRIVKDFDPRDQKMILDDLAMVVKVLRKHADDLFADEMLARAKKEDARKKREAAEKKAAAEEATKKGRSPDHPRSDPKTGGAGKAKKKGPAATVAASAKKSDEHLQKQIAKANEAAEQSDGDKVLKKLAPQTGAAKKSQTAIAAEKVAEAMSPGGKLN